MSAWVWWVELLFSNILSLHLVSICGIYVHFMTLGFILWPALTNRVSHRWQCTAETRLKRPCMLLLALSHFCHHHDVHTPPGLLPPKGKWEPGSPDLQLINKWMQKPSWDQQGLQQTGELNKCSLAFFFFFLLVLNFESFYRTPVGKQGKKICGSVWYICSHKSRIYLETHILLKQNIYQENCWLGQWSQSIRRFSGCLLP